MSTEITPRMRRSILIAALRDPKLEKYHEWNFCGYAGCAVGLANKIFQIQLDVGNTPDNLQDFFGTCSPFLFNDYPWPPSSVTPAMVADRLESLHNAMGEK